MFKGLTDEKLKLFYGNVNCKNMIYCILSVFIILTYSIWKIYVLNYNCKSKNSVRPNWAWHLQYLIMLCWAHHSVLWVVLVTVKSVDDFFNLSLATLEVTVPRVAQLEADEQGLLLTTWLDEAVDGGREEGLWCYSYDGLFEQILSMQAPSLESRS